MSYELMQRGKKKEKEKPHEFLQPVCYAWFL